MEQFGKVYDKLNAAQRKAVDTIYGPVLVIAGPGTGKTQLLSARVAHILEVTDAMPSNILCLTFTENGALNMRERLTRFIGPSAYDVQISTYHGFGSSIIGRFPQYFTQFRLEKPVDELAKHQILSDIVDELDYDNPLKYIRYSLGDLVGTISEIKRGLLSPSDLRQVADENLKYIAATHQEISEALSSFSGRMSTKLGVALPAFETVREAMKISGAESQAPGITKLSELAIVELQKAIETAELDGSTKPLTAWKGAWLEKDNRGDFILKGRLEALRMRSLAGILESYQTELAKRGLYDFDDMILEAIRALEKHDDLRYTLQEQYQFILLDEFQDTNAAQLRLVQLMTDNAVNEGRPNVLAVGDDDQAIYAFQGAEVSNMLDFAHMYKDVVVITLTENYRSHQSILDMASTISGQIGSRLHSHFDGVTKELHAASNINTVQIERIEYASDVAEREGIAAQIAKLIKEGSAPSNIAVLAPKHRYLEPLVAHLQAKSIPVTYEKRENILDSSKIVQLLTMSKLVLAVQSGRSREADSLWPEVLSYDFWNFSVADIWRLSWQVSDERKQWSELLLEKSEFRHAALLVLSLAGRAQTETAETILDSLIGTSEVQTHDRSLPSVRSPFREYYFRTQGPNSLYETTTEITVLREKYRQYCAVNTARIRLADLLDFVHQYELADQQMLNTSPYNQAESAVQLMTVFKAKGLEYDHVFVIDTENEVWGSRAGGAGSKLTLPANLAHIRHAGSSEDEKLRAFFVAITRAKLGLHMTSHTASYSGKRTERLKYLDEVEDNGIITSRNLPEPYQTVTQDGSTAIDLATIELNWLDRHTKPDVALRTLLSERLAAYHLSPTHLTKFIDLKYGGPESFLVDILLRFPSAPTIESVYGNAIHEALQFVQDQVNLVGKLPEISEVIERATEYLRRSSLPAEDIVRQERHAAKTLTSYLSAHKDFRPGNVAEKNFKNEGALLGDLVQMGGKIDLLEIDKAKHEITVVDYKTSSSTHATWKPMTLGLHKYQLQLYAYKLLVESSTTYRGYRVTKGRIDFTEPDHEGDLHNLELVFDDAETERVQELILAIWKLVQSLDFPDITSYTDSLTATKQFESDLIENHK